MRGLLLGAAAASMLLVGAGEAWAAFPGQSGRIAYNVWGGPGEIYSVNPDGSGITNLSNHPQSDSDPAWSADGRKIAFTTSRGSSVFHTSDIAVMNADGSGQALVTNDQGTHLSFSPSWSPDGSRIVFSRDGQISIMNADGTGLVMLFNSAVSYEPVWSPRADKIAFGADGACADPECDTFYTDIWIINPNGTGETKLVERAMWPNWSPDGNRLTFGTPGGGVWTMNPDGTDQVQVASNGDEPAWSPDGRKIVSYGRASGSLMTVNADGTGPSPLPGVSGVSPDWQPVPHDAPQSASPITVALVPAFRQTISASQCPARGGTNSTHGSPLAFASCNPPGYLPNTMARLGPSSSSSASVSAVPGDFSTVADDADLSFTVNATDVTARPGGGDYNPSASPDATLNLLIRLTDTDSSNSFTAAAPATTKDFVYPVPVDCAATADPSLGSTCSANTSADALAVGTVVEGKRSVMTVSRFWIYDSGLNGNRGDADDRQFAQSGIYIP